MCESIYFDSSFKIGYVQPLPSMGLTLAPANTVKGSLIISVRIPEPWLLFELVHFREWTFQ